MLDLVREIFAGLKKRSFSSYFGFCARLRVAVISPCFLSVVCSRQKRKKSFFLFLRRENVEELFEAIARDLFLMSKVGEAVKQTLNRLIESF